MPSRSCIFALCAAVFASASLAGEVPASHNTTAAEAEGYTQAFEKAFRTAFGVRFVNQCVASARAVATKLDLTPSCVCMSESLLATKSVTQLQEMKFSPANDEMKSLIASCLKSDAPWPDGQDQVTEGRSRE